MQVGRKVQPGYPQKKPQTAPGSIAQLFKDRRGAGGGATLRASAHMVAIPKGSRASRVGAASLGC